MKFTKKTVEKLISEELLAVLEAFGDAGAFEDDSTLRDDSGLNPDPVPVRTKPTSIAALAVMAMQAILAQATAKSPGAGTSATAAGGLQQDVGAGKGRDFVDGQMGPLTRKGIRAAGTTKYDGSPMTIRFDGKQWIISEIGSIST